MVVVLDTRKFVGSMNGLVVEDTIELEGKFEGRDIDIKLGFDSILAVELNFHIWI